MMHYIITILFTTLIFLAVVLSLAIKPDFSKKVLGFVLLIASLGGLILYGYGYAVVESNPLIAILKALHSTCGMIVGGDDLKEIAAAAYINETWVQVIFWIIRTLAFYAFAGTIFSIIGVKILEKIRMVLSKRRNIILIYGIGEDALAFGKECVKENQSSVVFLSSEANNDVLLKINQMGAVIQTGDTAIHPAGKTMKNIGIRRGSRKIDIYLMESERKNYIFAKELRDCFKTMGIFPEQTSLVLLGEEESLAGKLQVYRKGKEVVYGYGNVSVVRIYDQISRLMVSTCLPCDTISFDENGVAQENFEVLILGFGRLGQSVLRELIKNGQFKGSRFKATVIDPNCNKATGYFLKRYPEILTQYDITLIDQDGRSKATFDYLEDNLERIKYVVSAIGDDTINEETARQADSYLRSYGICIPVISCGKKRISVYQKGDPLKKEYPLYTRKLLDFSKRDLIAMKIHHKYSACPENSLWDDWKNCDYFSRMSNRAFADFIPAFLRMLHMTADDVKKIEGKPLPMTDIQRDVLGETEHLRWSAFHYTMGYSKMSWEEWEKRAVIYREQIEAGVEPKIRIGKETKNRRHICLLDWEELDILNAKEKQVTGKDPDYKQKDIDNVEMIPELLK